MSFRRILRDQIKQSLDLVEIFILLLIPVFFIKALMDFLMQGQIFWLNDALVFLRSASGFILLLFVIEVGVALRRYWSR
ncbi:hypothetical protein [Levilactobacillus lindianensis]|uniref:hypothetical protein n=1 Tax=Levilactobacillus lindianensis TaxID=2486018 RepID=UPI000F743E96|nr:hypothetical protein [Levilactobacillus lindianensis]